MPKLYLFDIDGTLLGGVSDSTLAVGGKEDRFTSAIKRVVGVDAKRDKDFRGLTDYLILVTMLKDIGWNDGQIKAAMPALLKELDTVHAGNFQPDNLELLPGVKQLLLALHNCHQCLGLLTGNLEPVAKRKLEAFDIWQFFSVGGFGSDPHETRADLVLIAVERAGFSQRLDDVYVIGDTPKDIEAAHEAGVSHSIGVANGYRSADELVAAGAKIVFDDLRNTQEVLAKLGLPE